MEGQRRAWFTQRRQQMKVGIELVGMTPYMQHNARLSDNSDPINMEIAAISKKKTNKTDVEALRREELEFLGGLYHDPEMGVYVPGPSVLRCLEEAAKITKKGKSLLRALSPSSDKFKLVYDGPKTPAQLWKDPTFRSRMQVRVNAGRITRIRPMFRKWSVTFEGEFLEDAGLDKSELMDIAKMAGLSVGLGDARKLGYGRFSPEVKFSNGTVRP